MQAIEIAKNLMKMSNAPIDNYGVREKICLDEKKSIVVDVYAPVGEISDVKTIVMIPPMGKYGSREPAWVRFCQAISMSGFRVISAEIPSLMQYVVSDIFLDEMADVICGICERTSYHNGSGKVGLLGTSYSGMWTLCSLGLPKVQDKISSLVFFGTYYDIGRIVRHIFLLKSEKHIIMMFRLIIMLNVIKYSGNNNKELINGLKYVVDEFADVEYEEGEYQDVVMSILQNQQEKVSEPVFAQLKDIIFNLNNAAIYLEKYQDGFNVIYALTSKYECFNKIKIPIFIIHGAEDEDAPVIEPITLYDELMSCGADVHLLLTNLVSGHANMKKYKIALIPEVIKFIFFMRLYIKSLK